MPDQLRAIDFSEQLLTAVQDFDAGSEEWQHPLAAWIKAAPDVPNGAIFEMRKRKGALQIWLYVNQGDELVGYGSLGKSNWEWPSAEDPRVPLSVIPNVAVQRKFWGQPKTDPPKYSKQILDHLIFEARQHKDRKPLLGLFVHPQNIQAIKAYESAGFREYFRKYLEDGVEYRSMLLKLAAEA